MVGGRQPGFRQVVLYQLLDGERFDIVFHAHFLGQGGDVVGPREYERVRILALNPEGRAQIVLGAAGAEDRWYRATCTPFTVRSL